jgi:hypothetical protein
MERNSKNINSESQLKHFLLDESLKYLNFNNNEDTNEPNDNALINEYIIIVYKSGNNFKFYFFRR